MWCDICSREKDDSCIGCIHIKEYRPAKKEGFLIMDNEKNTILVDKLTVMMVLNNRDYDIKSYVKKHNTLKSLFSDIRSFINDEYYNEGGNITHGKK